MAAIVNKHDSQLKCGATIIDQYYALTAAHCVNSPGMFADDIKLLVGEHDYRTSMIAFFFCKTPNFPKSLTSNLVFIGRF